MNEKAGNFSPANKPCLTNTKASACSRDKNRLQALTIVVPVKRCPYHTKYILLEPHILFFTLFSD